MILFGLMSSPYPFIFILSSHQFMKIQSKPHDEVFKPQAADDLRGRI